MNRTFHPRRLAWALLLVAGSCALPELTIDSRLDDEDDEDDGGGGTGDAGGRGGADQGGSGASGGTSGTDQGGNGGTGGASGGNAGKGGSTGGKGGATGGTAGTGGCTGPGDCDFGESCCTGTCVDAETDPDHCGACGAACPAPRACSDGRCACASGLTYCASSCVNTNISLTHCGACDEACGPDQMCTQGSCTGPCGATFAVTPGGWVTAPGSAGSCWRGYAYTVPSATSTVSPADFENCGMDCMLCMTGSVPATDDFSGWVSLGVSVAMASNGNGSSISPEGNALQISFTNALNSPLRVVLDGETNSDDDRWCVDLPTTSPAVIDYADFRTYCWDTIGRSYNGEPITSISLQVYGNDTNAVPFNACITSFADVDI